MSIAQMAKVMIISHRTQVSDLLEALQAEGICQILNAEDAIVSRDFPELAAAAHKPKDVEALLNRLQKSIEFLENYAQARKGLAAALAPRIVIEEHQYSQVVSDEEVLKIIDETEQIETSMEAAQNEIEHLHNRLEMLEPWASLETPVEEIDRLWQTTCFAGLIPAPQFEQALAGLEELGAALQQISSGNSMHACIIVSLTENLDEVQKLLRSAEFETVAFEPMTGIVSDLISEHAKRLDDASKQLKNCKSKAVLLSENLLKLRILHDHYGNLLNRDRTRDTAPATEQTVILEAWVKKNDYARLERIVSNFEAAGLAKIKPAEDEETPVEIENKTYVRPFESITRLYGMPGYINVDPTIFLAPFFALFFALCLTDAGYGLIMIAIIAYLIRKMQGDKKMMWMFIICSAATVVAGALTGGWFGDAIQQFIPSLKPLRESMLWFDPFEKPMTFFALSLALGFFQIITGITIAFVHNLRTKQFAAAVFDQLTWLVMLNSIALFGLSKAGFIHPGVGKIFGLLALVPAVAILLFSERKGALGARLGMGFYNLFSAIFFLGDILSYVRLMALGMVTAGFAMAINVIAKIVIDVPYIGYVLAALILIGGHLFNTAMSALSAFVHTLRLQFVEFFPKFFVGSEKMFVPLSKKYNHIYIRKDA